MSRRPPSSPLFPYTPLFRSTARPTAAWVTQQARQLSWQIQDGALPVRFLIHDRDNKFPAAFDTIFTSEDVRVVRRSEEHTSELQSRQYLVCRLLLEKKKKKS